MAAAQESATLDEILLYMHVARHGYPQGRWADHGVLHQDLVSRFTQESVDDLLWHPELAARGPWAPKLNLVQLTARGDDRGKVLAKRQADQARGRVVEWLSALPIRLTQFLFLTSSGKADIPDERGSWCLRVDSRVESLLAPFLDLGREFGLVVEVSDYVATRGGEVRDPVLVIGAGLLDACRDYAQGVPEPFAPPSTQETSHRLFHFFQEVLEVRRHFTIGQASEHAKSLKLPIPRVRQEIQALHAQDMIQQSKRIDLFTIADSGDELFWSSLRTKYLRPFVDWLTEATSDG